MKELLLIIATVSIAVILFFAVKKTDKFLESNRKLISDAKPENSVTIAAENPLMLNALNAAIERLSKCNKNAEFYLKTGRCDSILQALDNHNTDIAVVFEKSMCSFKSEYGSIGGNYYLSAMMYDKLSLPIEPIEYENKLLIIWNKNHMTENCSSIIKYLQSSLI